MTELLDGVALTPVLPHADDRGVFIEAYRREWPVGFDPVQWGLVRSRAGTLRGVHVHPVHDDYLLAIEGAVRVGLHDLRPDSASYRESMMLELGPTTGALVIPCGVAHGLDFPAPAGVLLGVSHTFDPADELGCRFDDPELNLEWSSSEPILSERDRALPSLQALIEELARVS